MSDKENKNLVPETVSENTDVTPKKKSRVKRILLAILLILLALLAAVAVVLFTLPRAVIDANIQSVSEFEESEVAVTPDLPPVRQVQNIALFGIDQEEGSVGRSDAIIILSIDKDHNKIKMTSLARDSLVPIDGHGEEKLTHAWAYGHAKLALKTINQNFGMNITEYAYVNFEGLIDAVDYLGGVYIHLDSAEMELLNASRRSFMYAYNYKIKVPVITSTGINLLNGRQALAYARNRADGDSNRTGRQREVLTAMYERVKAQPLSKLPGIVTQLLKLCHSSLNGSEIMSLATWALTSSPTIESLSLPNEQLKPWNGVIDRQRGWVRVYDLEAATLLLHRFIYETDAIVSDVTQYNPSTTTSKVEE